LFQEISRTAPPRECFKLVQSAHLQYFTLPAGGAGEDNAQFPGVIVELAHQSKAIRAALEAFYVETSEGAFWRGAWRLVVLTSDKISGGIHAAKYPRVGGTSADQPAPRFFVSNQFTGTAKPELEARSGQENAGRE
jgi:hypothetical protein